MPTKVKQKPRLHFTQWGTNTNFAKVQIKQIYLLLQKKDAPWFINNEQTVFSVCFAWLVLSVVRKDVQN